MTWRSWTSSFSMWDYGWYHGLRLFYKLFPKNPFNNFQINWTNSSVSIINSLWVQTEYFHLLFDILFIRRLLLLRDLILRWTNNECLMRVLMNFGRFKTEIVEKFGDRLLPWVKYETEVVYVNWRIGIPIGTTGGI